MTLNNSDNGNPGGLDGIYEPCSKNIFAEPINAYESQSEPTNPVMKNGINNNAWTVDTNNALFLIFNINKSLILYNFFNHFKFNLRSFY